MCASMPAQLTFLALQWCYTASPTYIKQASPGPGAARHVPCRCTQPCGQLRAAASNCTGLDTRQWAVFLCVRVLCVRACGPQGARQQRLAVRGPALPCSSLPRPTSHLVLVALSRRPLLGHAARSRQAMPSESARGGNGARGRVHGVYYTRASRTRYDSTSGGAAPLAPHAHAPCQQCVLRACTRAVRACGTHRGLYSSRPSSPHGMPGRRLMRIHGYLRVPSVQRACVCTQAAYVHARMVRACTCMHTHAHARARAPRCRACPKPPQLLTVGWCGTRGSPGPPQGRKS